MKLLRAVSLFVVSAALLSVSVLGQKIVKDETGNFAKGELLVKFKNGTASREAQLAPALIGGSIIESFPDTGWQLLRLPEGASVKEAQLFFENLPAVENAQPNYIYRVTATPNDARFSELYGMQKISAPAAWDITTGNSNIVVAIIDTGVRYTHEDLNPNMWRNPGETPGNGVDDDGNGYVDDYYGYDFINNDSNPDDDYNHGTHVAGTIGAVGNNSTGVTGVNWNVRMMALKIHDSTGNSTAAKIVEVYQYVRMMKLRGVNIRVTNNSYGGAPEAPGYDQATKDAIDAVGDLDILNCFAAGNNNSNNESTPFYPASYNSPSILAVASSDQNDNKSGFSNYGAANVDLAAPGSSILSTVNGSNTSYSSLSGTSMATPHVAGAAALLAAANPNLSAASLKASLMNRVTVLAQWTNLVKTGGRMNLLGAMQNQTVCNFSFSTQFPAIPASGGNINVNVTAPQNCDFAAVSLNLPWLKIASGNPGSGNSTVIINAEPNTGAQRTGTVKIAGQSITITQSGASAPQNRAVLDFDGDGRTDYSVVQNSNGSLIWHNFSNTSGYRATVFGLANDLLVPMDYDGDRKWDIAVWRGGANPTDPAYFYILKSETNSFEAVQWGLTSDNPRVSQDFLSGSAPRAEIAVTRKVNGLLYWFIRDNNGSLRTYQFGTENDLPVRGDFDGDGLADLAVYRRSNGNPANTFIIQRSSDAAIRLMNFGVDSDLILPADFDGDGKTDFAVWRLTNGFWYWLESSTGTLRAVQFGSPNMDEAALGDYDGDGKTDPAVWRGNVANQPAYFYVNGSTSGFTAFSWGQLGMRVPINQLHNQF